MRTQQLCQLPDLKVSIPIIDPSFMKCALNLYLAHHFCYRPGQPCSKNKRTLDALTSILAEPEEPLDKRDPEADAYHNFCYRPGQPCSKNKRALDNLAAAVEEINDLTENY